MGISTAFVLGAGLGTRLRPLTEDRPKPLVPIFHKPLITFAFDHLRAFGVSRFIVNTHHRGEAYSALLGESGGAAEYAGCRVAFRHEPVLLDTGGGIKNIQDLVGDESFLVFNGDVLADLAVDRLIASHIRSGNIATIGLRSHGGPLHVQWNPETGLMADVRNQLGLGANLPSFLFTGVYILSPAIFDHIPAGEITSIIPILLGLIRAGTPIGGVILDEGTWFDLGTRESYLECHRRIAAGDLALTYPLDRPWPEPIHPSVRLPADVTLKGFVAIGEGAAVGAGAELHDTVLWEGAEIAPGARLESCIVRDHRHAGGDRRNADF